MQDRRSWSDADLLKAYHASRSVAEIIQTLGLVAAGGNYKSIHKHCKRIGLDVTLLPGQGWSKGTHVSHGFQARPLEDILVEDSTYASSTLRPRLIDQGLLENLCQECGNPAEWRGKLLVLHLDHINGNSSDNRIGNLRLLCPNCHSQTSTYCGRNIGRAALAQKGEA